MDFIEKLSSIRKRNKSLLCVGLDPDRDRIPRFLLKERDPLLAFNKKIVESTKDLVCAYKLNLAFYLEEPKTLERTRDLIPSHIPVILDAKCGDIGNTARVYARIYFELMGFDAVTLNPYMGFDAISPFFEYRERFIFLLCLTSNPSVDDFQTAEGSIYLRVAKKASEWNKMGNCGLVVGATRTEYLPQIRSVAPKLIFLIPGVGAQGGKLNSVMRFAADPRGEKIIINSSRGVIFASSNPDFSQAARREAERLREEINSLRPKEISDNNSGKSV